MFIKPWKEILIVLISVFSFTIWVRKKENTKLDSLDTAIIIFCATALISGIFFTGNGFPENTKQIIWGVKYGLLFLALFLMLRQIPLHKNEKENLINIVLLSGTAVILFGIAQATVLPEDFLISFGYNPEYGNTDLVGGISYCHKIENALTHEEFCRVQSTLSGPNQLGAYLLIILPLFLYRIFTARGRNKVFYIPPFLGGIFVLLFTWSRSAWIGAVTMAATFFIIQARKPWAALSYLLLLGIGLMSIFLPILTSERWDELKFLSLTGAGFMLMLMLLMFVANLQHRFFSQFGGFLFPTLLSAIMYVRARYDTFFWNNIVRPSSSQGHWERWSDGVKYMIENPLGLGLGDAGPASIRFAHPGETGFLPESWYLQVGLESGFIGLVLFLSIILLLGYKLLTSESTIAKPLFLGLIGISTAAIFLHSWESAVVAFSFWSLAAIALMPTDRDSLVKRISNSICKLFFKQS